MPRDPQSVTVLGKRYGIERVAYGSANRDGECDPPNAKRKKIYIRENLSKRRLAIVLAHECIHASCWHLDEEYVTQFAEDVVRILEQFDLLKTE